MTTDHRPDVEAVMRGLKDLQRATVEYVHRRRWTDYDAVKRFLVADEVDLGKTLVAKGLIATTVDHLGDTPKRIDIVYICSNQQIARQNLSRLNVVDGQKLDHADRLTMLPTVIKRLNDRRINIVSFTPGTSFHVKGGGKAPERVVLYWLLAAAYGRDYVRPTRWLKFFRGSSGRESFARQLDWFDRSSLDADIVVAFRDELEKTQGPNGRPLRTELEECVQEFNYLRGDPPWKLSSRRYALVGALRSVVARAPVEALETDLVIMDESQRFKDLMAPGSDAAELAHAIFNHPDAKVLLLSAAPFKMYTLPDEPEGDDHYRDFVSTVRFLAGDDQAAGVEADLRTMRSALVDGSSVEAARAAKDRVETALRRVMCRTERPAVSTDPRWHAPRDPCSPRRRRGHRAASPARPERRCPRRGSTRRLRAVALSAVPAHSHRPAGLQGQGRPARPQGRHRRGAGAQGRRGHAPLGGRRAVPRSRPMHATRSSAASSQTPSTRAPGGSRGRHPHSPTSSSAAPTPLRPYGTTALHQATGVLCVDGGPNAISVMVSCEAERRATDQAASRRKSYSARRTTPLLQYRLKDGAPSSMPVLALAYPSSTLAQLGDPLAIARAVADRLPAPRDAVLDAVRDQMARALDRLPTSASPGPRPALVLGRARPPGSGRRRPGPAAIRSQLRPR